MHVSTELVSPLNARQADWLSTWCDYARAHIVKGCSNLEKVIWLSSASYKLRHNYCSSIMKDVVNMMLGRFTGVNCEIKDANGVESTTRVASPWHSNLLKAFRSSTFSLLPGGYRTLFISFESFRMTYTNEKTRNENQLAPARLENAFSRATREEKLFIRRLFAMNNVDSSL